MKRPSRNLVLGALALVVFAVLAGVWMKRGVGTRVTAAAVTTEAVARHDVSLTIEASATIEPVDLVEVKSKASGTITNLPVSAGSRVKAGDLLAQIDTRDVKNSWDQAMAQLRAAQAKVEVSRAQKLRVDGLFAQGVLTADEHEAALLDDANAQAALVTARTNLDLAKQKLDDATVRAPVDGTVLVQSVTAGQVISSATSSVSGGTTLLQMADLRRVRLRALVAETDVGHVHAGQRATVTVDAYPGRTFEGTVEKVEPQAVVEQSVTNFPVLVSISNEQGLLLPGMNGEVSLVVDRRRDVTAVPVDAVRNARQAAVLAPSLGLNADSVRAQVTRQRAALAASDTTRGALRAGAEAGTGARRAARSASGASRRSGASASAGAGGPGGPPPDGAPPPDGPAGASTDAVVATSANTTTQVVFVKTAAGIEPRAVRTGLSDFDWTQIVAGVKEGEQVVMLGVAEAQASRTNEQNNIRQRMSNMPGSLGSGTRSTTSASPTRTTGGGR